MTGINRNEELPAVRALGDAMLLVVFGAAIDASLNARVLAVVAHLAALRLPGILDLVPAWCTLGVHYDPCRWEADTLAARLRELCLDAPVAPATGTVLEIPVCYEGEFAPDMEHVCVHTGLAREEVVRRHSTASYRVHFLGFTPGFPYLGGLDPALAVPRRATPRTRVPAGSVAIGGQQAGVYPMSAPGGWQLIGRTALCLFDGAAASPCRLAPGDTVRFVPVGESALRAQLAASAGP
jgi:KipI family sensor histidine kinase inhibitor